MLYCKYAARQGYKYCRVKSPDTDVFFILLHHAASIDTITILFDTGSGNNQRLLNITELANTLSPTYCSTLMVLHAYSGCDTTSALKGIGKVKPMKVLTKHPHFTASLSTLGDNWTVNDDLMNTFDAFTCIVYGNTRIKSVDKIRYVKINDLCSAEGILPTKNIDLGSLPPSRKSLEQHLLRANYQVAIWKNSHIPNPQIPCAEGHGWMNVDGRLEPKWFEGDMLPQLLIDHCDSDEESADENDNSDDESDDEDVANHLDEMSEILQTYAEIDSDDD